MADFSKKASGRSTQTGRMLSGGQERTAKRAGGSGEFVVHKQDGSVRNESTYAFEGRENYQVHYKVDQARRKGAAAVVSYTIFPDGRRSDVEVTEVQAERAEAETALAAARQRGESRAAEILAGDDMLSADEMAVRLGVSRVSVNGKRKRHALLALQGAARGFKYPSWQLDRNDRPFPALAAIADRLGGDEWTLYRFLVQHHNELGGMTGIEALRKRRDVDVLAAAESVARAFA